MAADNRAGGHAPPAKQPEDETETHMTSNELAEVKSLYSTIQTQLTTTANGEFFEGTKSSNAARHNQSGEMFKLSSRLEGVITGLETKAAQVKNAAEAEVKKEEQKAGRANTNLTATIKSIVAAQLSDELRDPNIKIERLEQCLKKSEDENKKLRDKVQALESKIKKPSERNGCTAEQYNTLNRKVNGLSTQVEKCENANSNNRLNLSKAETRLTNDIQKVSGNLSTTEMTVAKHSSEIISQRDNMNQNCEIDDHNRDLYERRHEWVKTGLEAIRQRLGLNRPPFPPKKDKETNANANDSGSNGW